MLPALIKAGTVVMTAVARAKGPNSKAKAGGAMGAVVAAGLPTLDLLTGLGGDVANSFINGARLELLPYAEQMGVIAVQGTVGWLVAFAGTWVAEANKRWAERRAEKLAKKSD